MTERWIHAALALALAPACAGCEAFGAGSLAEFAPASIHVTISPREAPRVWASAGAGVCPLVGGTEARVAGIELEQRNAGGERSLVFGHDSFLGGCESAQWSLDDDEDDIRDADEAMFRRPASADLEVVLEDDDHRVACVFPGELEPFGRLEAATGDFVELRPGARAELVGAGPWLDHRIGRTTTARFEPGQQDDPSTHLHLILPEDGGARLEVPEAGSALGVGPSAKHGVFFGRVVIEIVDDIRSSSLLDESGPECRLEREFSHELRAMLIVP